jgi:hypothetical protein
MGLLFYRLKELKVFHILSDVHGTSALLFARVLHSDRAATGFGIKILLTHILVIKFDGSFYCCIRVGYDSYLSDTMRAYCP